MTTSHGTTEKRCFSHLSAFDRGQIQAFRQAGKSMQAIADAIGHHKSTISQELQRGTTTQRSSDLTKYQTYFPETGQAVYEANRAHCGAKYKLAHAASFVHFAVAKIQSERWSPDAVCGHANLHQLYEGAKVCTKTLYYYIDKGLLPIKNIDLLQKVRRKTKTKRPRVNKRIYGTSIEERPEHLENREEFGHWEIDTVLGQRLKGTALLTLTERQTRKEIIMKIGQKTSEAVNQAVQRLKTRFDDTFSSVFQSITSDNGSEFSELTEAVDCDQVSVYYTHPYTSSERGTNQRHNGLIRRFIPKGKSIDDLDDSVIAYVENWCNTLPRKILGYQSPNDRYEQALTSVI
ncbi:IS30 family transposase [Salibacterium qingdaonense]|uniref:Transposase and inactivated derivatives, IS30 family n=1 Tax=Salibacterium qingdaonense TaxID=266892 RepID=A0A1I4LUZ4_9BACI|nr:IS30 family transposase [Salibacterium qingdaonense]SFL94706.1 Transposase and inactivated derivatives, IS30 family [Salibacterium qingdaonense]